LIVLLDDLSINCIQHADCPGTESDQAGKAAQCAGCPNQTICATAPKGPDPDIMLINERLKNVKNIILVLSGKGGVGKSSVSAQLAFALASKGLEVGLLDIDICGPSIPRMLGLEGQEIHQSSSGWSPVYVDENLGVMSIGFMLSNPDDAVIWRGPRKNGLIKQFLKDVDWGELDYLVIDAPPGTSDEHISVVQFLLPCHRQYGNLAGSIVVTSPQEISLIDVRKEINFCFKTGVPILGIVENMSGFTSPISSLVFIDSNGKDVTEQSHEALSKILGSDGRVQGELLYAKQGAVEMMASKFGVMYLGKVPLDIEMSKAAEEGRSLFDVSSQGKITASISSLESITAKILDQSKRN